MKKSYVGGQHPPLGIGKNNLDSPQEFFKHTRRDNLSIFTLQFTSGINSTFKNAIKAFGLPGPETYGPTMKKELVSLLNWGGLLMGMFPIIHSLLMRYSGCQHELPAEYHYKQTDYDLGFLDPTECGWAALAWTVTFFALGSWAQKVVTNDGKVNGLPQSKAHNSHLSYVEIVLGMGWRSSSRDHLLFAKENTYMGIAEENLRSYLSSHSKRGEVICGDRGDFFGIVRFAVYVSVFAASFLCVGPNSYTNWAVILLTSVGLGIVSCVDKLQTGVLPFSYSMFWLNHTSSSTFVVMAILMGQIVGGSRGSTSLVSFFSLCYGSERE